MWGFERKSVGYRKRLVYFVSLCYADARRGTGTMLNQISKPDLLLQMARELRRKNYRPGFDGMTAQKSIVWLELNGEKLCRSLRRGTYDPMPATIFHAAKPSGG